ncbi:eukaryotic and archaeal DNA primase, large subunit-domain-containing protein [Mucor mucedo]|uniref:eukaryotic and archaeal DNA primase, large subunit-domain-containing protein n=1 Tax=Mucor mucedo TaxID=29922 RepID=UPI00221F7254|nr:eukaryotic and archaeal DNA primase, large subunit-domain-containing protein [Mucor mucedo]KAI7893439.1 eukaryotic and archaeal DNA primase, large subunit-domain-containing protein [Mucor mucedo]
MTTLYDQPYNSDSDSSDDNFELNEYDLDVVDDALLNPNRSEYLDHFGFKIQVRTDDESSSDDDSDFDEKQKTTSDDDSIDTNLATPHDDHHKQNFSLTTNVPILKSPPSPKPERQRSVTTTSRSSNESRHSIFNPFKSTRPASVTSSIGSPVTVVSRPSQSFQQRQSKRFSEIPNHTGTPRSPASNHRNFDKLVSKFRRFSHNDHQYDSEKHLLLKHEALAELQIYREKGGFEYNSIDWDFWVLVIQNFGRVIETQMDDMRQHLIAGGIPSPIRGLMWQIISKSRDSFDMDTEYKILRTSASPFEKQIQRDLTRTFPNHPYFMQESGRQSLFNVAKAYSIFDQEVGYCQGLAFIIGCLLLHMSEGDAFCVLIKLMGKYGLRGHFTPRMEVLHQHMYQFDNVFQQKLPVIHRHMENEGVTPSMYVSQWFITLFSYRCPIELSFRVIDLLLVEGTQILVQIALALIIRNQEKILKLRFESLVEFLCNGIFTVFAEDGDGFVQDTYRVDLPARFMARLAQQYTGEEARESKSMSQEDNLRRVNGQLSEHIRSVESSLSVLQIENKDITQQIISSKMDMARTEDEKEHLRHELNQVKAEFDQYQRNMALAYDKQMNQVLAENRKLKQQNIMLADQLEETESLLINMKLSFAERESEFEALKRQLYKKYKVVNRFAAAAEASKGRVYSDTGKDYNLKKDYPFRLNFYLKPPPMEITIEEFEVFALDRLQVLRAIDTASLRNRDIAQEAKKAIDTFLPLKSNLSKSDSLYEERRKDHISHYVLRMAYCRSDELQEWFIKQECELFKYRFDQEPIPEKKKFLEDLNLNWKMLTTEEKESMRRELELCSRPKKSSIGIHDYITKETFFEVDFDKVPQMVGRRGVYIKKGKAYVPMSEQVNIVMLEYKSYLKRGLESISKILPRLEEDDRLRPILQNVEKQYVGLSYNDPSAAAGTVTASQVDSLVQRYAPLCMRSLCDSLKLDHHLKHGGRLQYGLFIKGMGLSVDEALMYWKNAFSNITPDKFQKDYAYNVRYNYGLEGKRTNYSPYSCSKIIDNPPSATENHGCPFRHFSPSNLEARLLRDNIGRTHVDQILQLSRDRHYQLACTKHFEVTHPQDKTRRDPIEHPNQYYEASKSLDEELVEKTEQMDESI